MSTVAQYRDEQAWLEMRRSGIGGSDVAALFGMHPWKNAQDVWAEKTGKSIEMKVTADLLRGRYLEDIAVLLYEERTGRTTRRQPLRRHPKYEFLLASIDRQILAGARSAEDEWPTHPLEIKCPRSRTFYRLKHRGLSDYMILQGQHEALVWNYDRTSYGIFGADDFEILTFEVAADAEVSERIIEVCGEFWTKYVLTDTPPPVEEAATVDLPEVSGTMTYREDDEFARVAADWWDAKELEAEAKAVRDHAREQLIALVGDGNYGAFEGSGYRFYYEKRAGRVTFDKKALEASKPVDGVLAAAKLLQYVPAEILGEVMGESRLDLTQFNKTGKSFAEVRGYRVKGEDDGF